VTRPFLAGAATGDGPTPIDQPLGQRIVGVIRRPAATFRQVVAAPSWAGALLFSALISVAAGAALMETQVGRQAQVDQWERTATAFGRHVDDAAYARLEELSRANGVEYASVSALISGPLLSVVIAALLPIFFRAGRSKNGVAPVGAAPATVVPQQAVGFRQALAVTAHAGVILALRQVIAAPVTYARESVSTGASLGLWFSTLDEAAPVARFLGAIDLFVVWWLVVLAIGTAALFGVRAGRTAGVFFAIYAALAVLLAIAMALSGGSA